MTPKNLRLLAEKQARRTLQTDQRFRSLSAEEQKPLLKRFSRALEKALKVQTNLDVSSALDSFAEDGLAADYLNALVFPTFVQDLIEGTFDAELQNNLKQMEAYRALMKAAVFPLSKFSKQISDRAAVDYLHAPSDPQDAQQDAAPRGKKTNGHGDSKTAIRAAKLLLAERQRRLLREVTLSGVGRLLAGAASAKERVFPKLDLETDPYNPQLRNKLIRGWFLPAAPARRNRGGERISERPRRVGDLSGGHWVARFPGSNNVIDLEPVFRAKVNRFLAAMSAAGASVRISSTFRPPERAYLMHWSWKIFRGIETGENIPPKAGVDIIWWHGDAETSKRAATDMVNGYGISTLRVAPALNSRHTERKAIDMTIGWNGRLVIRTAQGQNVTISTEPRDGTNARLIEVGRTYEVIHFLDVQKDKPHWSTDGR